MLPILLLFEKIDKIKKGPYNIRSNYFAIGLPISRAGQGGFNDN